MQAQKLTNPSPAGCVPTTDPDTWQVIRADRRRLRTCRRRWRRIHARSSFFMTLCGPLFVLVYLAVSMLSPQDHLLPGILLLLLLAAEAASVVICLISEAVLSRISPSRTYRSASHSSRRSRNSPPPRSL